MRKLHLLSASAAFALAAILPAADILPVPSAKTPATSASQPATLPWSGAPPTAAEFPVHNADIDDDQVLAAIKKGVDYLLTQRRGDNFEVAGGGYAAGNASNKGGETAIVVYALLHVEESVNDEEIRKKINFASPDLAPVITYLKNLQPDGTYVAGLLASALTLLPKTPEITAALERPQGAKFYLMRTTNNNGGYEYSVPGAVIDSKIADQEKVIADLRAKLSAPGKKIPGQVKGLQDQIKQAVADLTKQQSAAGAAKAKLRASWNPDGSNTQYGVLGAWALADYGIPMPPGCWQSQDSYWRRIETPEGASPYNKDPKSLRDTMAAAGLATLFITQEFLDTEPRLVPRNDKQMEAALSYITDTFNGKSYDQYYHYAVERVGLASGLKFFGAHNWYRELAATLIKSQNPDGSWKPAFYHAGGEGVTIATSYALLTLARGRNPVLVNKLSYSGPWNARPRDAARLTERMAKSFERPFNWQVVSHLIAPENWTDAPILLITGSEDPNFTPEVVQKLKAYTEMGGIIFSTADGDKPEFTEAMKKYAARIAPGKQMRELPADHPILNGELWVKVANPPKLLGLSNGVREIWVHSPTDMGAAWHKKDFDAKPDWDIPGNLYFYATGKTNLKSRLQSTVVIAPDTVPGPTLTLGRLMIGDNPDPEPGGWPRMARLMRVCCQTNIQIQNLTFDDLAKTSPAPPPALHLTGTSAFTLTGPQITTLHSYLANGGTLIADGAGMSPSFNKSFIQLAAKLYPNNPLTPLATTSPIYLGNYPNAKPIAAVRYRSQYSLQHNIPSDPHLLAVQPNPKASPDSRPGRYTIIYSPEDLTSGLLGTNTWGINGYTPESAQALARNILLYTLNHAPPAATQPAPTSQPTTTSQPASTQPAATQPAPAHDTPPTPPAPPPLPPAPTPRIPNPHNVRRE